MKKEVQMCAIITVLFKKPTNIDELNNDIGGFAIENEKGVIPFDFDAESRRVMPLSDSVYQIEYTSGHGPFFHDYDVSDSCDEEYAKLGLSRQDITARFLASATKLVEFYFASSNADGNSVPCEFTVKEIYFHDENGERFEISSEVLEKFNRDSRLTAANL